MRRTTRLKQMARRREAILVPGAANALFARVVEAAGFDCAYITGAGIANMRLGAPDIGLTTLSEIADTVWSTADAVDLPLIVDADTGFGNALNAYRSMRMLERAGAAAIQVEDQVFPKRCGHFSGKQVIPAAEMVQKIKAMADARIDDDLSIIARTDALAIDGIDAALDRARTYLEAGADITFVEAPTDEAQMARIACELEAPQVANIVFGGRTPEPGAERLRQMGFAFVLYANAALQAALLASREVLEALRRHGSLAPVADRLASFEMRQQAVAKDVWDAREVRYGAKG